MSVDRNKMITYSPLSLVDLCINTILEQVWNNNFDEIVELQSICENTFWKERFQRRHAIIRHCIFTLHS